MSTQSRAPAGTFLPNTKVQVGSHRVVIQKYLSSGGFAHVYLVRLPQPIDGEEMAVLKRVAVPDKDSLASMRVEVETMKKLKGHTYIVKYMDSHASSLRDGGYEVFLLMEFCNGGGLIDFMNTRLQNRLTEPEILKIFSDTCQGLAAMHYLRPPLLHRDLKVENILITETPGIGKQFKLCDFGSAAQPRPAAKTAEEGRLIEEDIQKNTTVQYRSPEMIDVYRKQPIDEKADIWALGVFLYKLCYYTTPFEEKGQMAILNASFKYPAYPQFSDRLKGLIAMMLQEQPSQRLNIYQVFKEVCAMRHRDCPLRDIYSGRTASEARQNQALPSSPRQDTPVGITKVVPPPKKELSIPEVTPMRRGRPTTTGANTSTNPSPSPGRPVSEDPFQALDGRQGVQAQTAAIEELSSKFPSLDQFSLLHESGGNFAFDSQAPPKVPPKAPTQKPRQTAPSQVQQMSQRYTEALADDVFSKAKGTAVTGNRPSEPPTPHTGMTNMATQTSSPSSPESTRPKMVSKSTMTSTPPVKTATPDVASRPIWKVPSSGSRSSSRTAQENTKPEPAPRSSLSVSRPPMLEHRSKSQTGMVEATATALSSANATADGLEPPKADAGGVHRARSTNTRNRPLSTSFEAASRIIHSRSPSASSRRLDKPAEMLIDTSEGSDREPIESNVDFLRQMEEDDSSKRHHKRLSSSGSTLANLKRASLPASGPKSLLSGRFGDALKRFEASESPPPLIDITSEQSETGIDASPTVGALSPIPDSEATGEGISGRSGGIVDEEIQDISPEMKRELERRQLAEEERRVAQAVAAHKQRVAANGTGKDSGSSRAAAIQNRVKALLDASAEKSPTKTAAGYGKYTNEAAQQDEEGPVTEARSVQPQQQRPIRPMTIAVDSVADLDPTITIPDRTGPKPNAPPKPQALKKPSSRAGEQSGTISMPTSPPPAATRTAVLAASTGPAVARKPAKLSAAPAAAATASSLSSTTSLPPAQTQSVQGQSLSGASLLQQRLAMDNANLQAGLVGSRGPAMTISATGPAASSSATASTTTAAGVQASAGQDEDWETSFSKRYPSLGNLEMEEMKI